MKKGDVVMVYRDPITEQMPEGKAELLKFINSDGEVEYWKVRFLDAGESVYRFIKIPHAVTEDELERIDLFANLAKGSKKLLKCDTCGMEYSDPKDFAYAEKMRHAWAVSQRAEGREPRGICPCPSFTCQGELVEKSPRTRRPPIT